MKLDANKGGAGQASLRRAVSEFLEHYHAERNHQGLSNRLIRSPPRIAANDGMIRRRQRLGGMLNFYYRKAACTELVEFLDSTSSTRSKT